MSRTPNHQRKRLWSRRTFLGTTLSGGLSGGPTGGLFQPSFIRELEKKTTELFPGRKTSALILSLDTGEVEAAFQAESFFRQTCPMGSLIKPFTALAFAVTHMGKSPPVFFCPPGSRQESMEDCWYPSGHGSISLDRALAHSCNRYFYLLAQDTARIDFLSILVRYGWIEEGPSKEFLSLPEKDFISLMTGFSLRLPTEPIRTAYAFAALYNEGRLFFADDRGEGTHRDYRQIQSDSSVLPAIQHGMRLCAQEGTGRLLGHRRADRYAKTGTISRKPGSHNPAHLEGWCIGLDLEMGQRVLVMTRVKPGRGATEAAPLAAEALSLLRRWRRPEGL